MLLFPNFADNSVSYTPAYSGGSWLAGLPLTNLKDRALENVARSTNAALTSTIVKVDLGVARSVRGFVVPKHTMSAAADVRWRVFAAVPVFEDTAFGAWTVSGTPVVTTGQTDPFGGTRAALVNDDDGAAVEYILNTTTFTGDGTKAIAVTAKQGTATASDIVVFDNTAPATRITVRLTWTAGVPALSVLSGSGTVYSVTSLGNGWYQVQFIVNSIVAANANRLRLYGASTTAATTGTTYYYEAMAFDYASQPILLDSGVVDAYLSTLTAEDVDGLNVPSVYIASAAVTGRYVRLEIADTANAAGYVDLARLFIATGYQPTINMSYGAKLGLEDDSVRSKTDGGAAKYQAKPVSRTLTFALENIQESEAFASAWKIQRLAGKTKQIYSVFDTADTSLMHERSFLGVLSELGALAFSQALYNAMGFQIVEDL